MTTEDWATGRDLPDKGNHTPEQQGEALWPAELISAPAPVLVPLSDDEWVNPQHVVSVVYLAKDAVTYENDPRVIVTTTKGTHVVRDRTAVEIVALLNGETE